MNISNRKQIFNIEQIKLIVEKIIKRHTVSGIDQLGYDPFIHRVDSEIDLIVNKVNSGNYKFSRYKEKLIVKNRNSNPRCISIPTHRDKITLKALSKVLKLYFPYIKQPLVHSVISKLISEIKSGKYTYFIKLDISSFYDNIDHKLLLKKITDYIDDSLIIDLVNKAIKNPIHPETRENKVGVHQGLSVSNFLAEIYMSEIDMKYSEIKDIFYIRYVDDIIILCNYGTITKLKKEFKDDAKKLNLKVSKQKSYSGNMRKKNFMFLGYNHYHNHNKLVVSPSPQSIIRFEKRIISLINKFRHKLKEEPKRFKQFVFEFNLLITGSVSKKVSSQLKSEKRYGWLFFYSQMTDLSVLYHIDNLVKKMLYFVSSDKIYKFKKITKAYYEQKYNFRDSTYFFRPDSLTIEEKKKILTSIYLVEDRYLTYDSKIDNYFHKIIYKQIKQQEIDLLTTFS